MNFLRAVLSTGYSQDPPICDVIWHHFIAALFFPAALLNLLRDLDKGGHQGYRFYDRLCLDYAKVIDELEHELSR